MGRANAVLLVLFVTGFVLFAYGTADRGHAAGPRVDVTGVDADDVQDGSDVVRYSELPESIRTAFDRALASDSSNSMASTAAADASVDADYVRYDGQYYELTIRSEGGSSVVLPIGLVGLVLSALSTVVYLLIRRESPD